MNLYEFAKSFTLKFRYHFIMNKFQCTSGIDAFLLDFEYLQHKTTKIYNISDKASYHQT